MDTVIGIIALFAALLVLIILIAAKVFKRKVLVKIGIVMLAVGILLFGMAAHYLTTHSEDNVKKLFDANKSIYEELVEIVLTKEPYRSGFFEDNAGMDIDYVNGKLIRGQWTKDKIELDDTEFEHTFTQLIDQCYVSSIHISKNEIKFACKLPQVTISFVYTPQEERKELNNLQTEIDDSWYMEWFRGY